MNPTAPHLLLVDDDRNLRRVLELQLSAEGLAVTTAGSAEEGAARLAEGRFDLIITDLRMPGMVRPERDRRLSPATGERFRKRCCVGLAGGSPVAVSAGAPRSRFRAAGEIPPSERNVESPQGVVRSLGGEQRRRPNARA